MIVALEGPDKCGKSTLLEKLRPLLPEAKFVPAIHTPPHLFQHMADLERRSLELWDALYDERTLYVTDRHVVVSSLVYGQLYNRPHPRIDSKWMRRVHVAYLSVPLRELERRHAEVGDPMFDASRYREVETLYRQIVVPIFKHRWFWPTLSAFSPQLIVDWVKELR